MRTPKLFAASLLILVLLPLPATRAAQDPTLLAQRIGGVLAAARGESDRFTLSATASLDGKPANVEIDRLDTQSLRVVVDCPEAAFRIQRTADRTVLLVPAKRVAFVGTGALNGPDTLAPPGLLERLSGDGSVLGDYRPLLTTGASQSAALVLVRLAALQSEDGKTWTSSLLRQGKLVLAEGAIQVTLGTTVVNLKLSGHVDPIDARFSLENCRQVAVDRGDLERMVLHGLRRALEVALPGRALLHPEQRPLRVPHGELRWVEGQRLVMLDGSPTEVGAAHGRLLKAEVRRCIDSSLYMVGLGETIESGHWSLDMLRGISKRVGRFIPEDHKAMMNALADASGASREEIALANIFPERFHCSGFAVLGAATRDHKLYHGRVLDYMAGIGLQDAAATFVVRPTGKHAYANIGYAGFVGCVSGMNDSQISLGEMGGAGQGNWDGVPMATLMLRALEECDSLQGVADLWSKAPRTCEYYYVWADGKKPDALGVKATPASIEFIRPGQDHPDLGAGISDVVMMSASDRLACLRDRITRGYGGFDEASALHLMDRPVAMRSNLHDVLFVPQDGVFYVANASHERAAAECPYVRYDLRALLGGPPMPASPPSR